MDLVLKAIRLADKWHLGQYRKVTGSEYMVHPIGVSYLVMKYKESMNMSILLSASLGHDLKEDTAITWDELMQELGIAPTSLIFELTDDKEKMKLIGKVAYCKKRWVAMTTYALYIKLCDRLYNLSDHPTILAVDQTIEILDHLEKKRKLTKSHKAVIMAIRAKIAEIKGGSNAN